MFGALELPIKAKSGLESRIEWREDKRHLETPADVDKGFYRKEKT